MSRALAMVFTFMIFALLATPVISAQPLCRESDVWANGTPGVLKSAAQRRARVAWVARVRGELGQAYTNWGIAKNRRITCVRPQQQRAPHYTCTVSARPCRA